MSHNNAHDFFKKFNNLFEGKEAKETAEEKAKKDADNYEKGNVRANWGDKAESGPGSTAKKEVKEGWSDENPDKDKSEEAEKAADKADYDRKAKRDDEATKQLDKKDKKPSNVKETASEFYRRYADIVNEAFGDDDEEDPDVKIADKEKGKDGKTQKDADKNLPPWLKGKMDKKDKESEDKGAKKAKKEKMESIQKEISNLEYLKAVKKINESSNKK